MVLDGVLIHIGLVGLPTHLWVFLRTICKGNQNSGRSHKDLTQQKYPKIEESRGEANATTCEPTTIANYFNACILKKKIYIYI